MRDGRAREHPRQRRRNLRVQQLELAFHAFDDDRYAELRRDRDSECLTITCLRDSDRAPQPRRIAGRARRKRVAGFAGASPIQRIANAVPSSLPLFHFDPQMIDHVGNARGLARQPDGAIMLVDGL
jgi:hypothetical protein